MNIIQYYTNGCVKTFEVDIFQTHIRDGLEYRGHVPAGLIYHDNCVRTTTESGALLWYAKQYKLFKHYDGGFKESMGQLSEFEICNIVPGLQGRYDHRTTFFKASKKPNGWFSKDQYTWVEVDDEYNTYKKGL